MISPHGGTLVNRIVEGRERETLLGRAAQLPKIELDAWALSDVEMIPPPAGLRRPEWHLTLPAKRSLQRRLPYWNSDRPPAYQQVVG